MYNEHCTLYIEHCTLYNEYCTLYNEHCTKYVQIMNTSNKLHLIHTTSHTPYYLTHVILPQNMHIALLNACTRVDWSCYISLRSSSVDT